MKAASLKALLALLLLIVRLPAGAAAYSEAWVEFPALKDFQGEAVQLRALMLRPPGPGPHAAVVMLHGCSGMLNRSDSVTASYMHRAGLLAQAGHVALLVDSFNPRGYRSICNLQKRPILQSRERVEDAYAALQWLAQQPYVDRQRVALMGWSNGAAGTLYALRASSRMEPGFRAAIAFYPGCGALSRAKIPYRPYAPLLVLIGEADDWTPAEPCRRLAEIARAEGAQFDIVIYPDAHHAFDSLNSPVRHRPNVRNLSTPGGKGATSGEHRAARIDAEKRALEFFSQMLKR